MEQSKSRIIVNSNIDYSRLNKSLMNKINFSKYYIPHLLYRNCKCTRQAKLPKSGPRFRISFQSLNMAEVIVIGARKGWLTIL